MIAPLDGDGPSFPSGPVDGFDHQDIPQSLLSAGFGFTPRADRISEGVEFPGELIRHWEPQGLKPPHPRGRYRHG